MLVRLARDDEGRPEIFRSIQGEGPMAGRERAFVRLSGCNLHCVWCDTAYTWNWQGSSFAHESARKFDPAAEMVALPIEEAAALIPAAEAAVFTGGEPLMQREALIALIGAVRARAPRMRIEIETNGTIAPGERLAQCVDLFVVSPKLAHSGNDAALALKPDALAAFAALDHAHFKVVCRTEEDVAAAAALAARYAIAAARVSVMPEGVTPEALDGRLPALTSAAAAHGLAISDRLHIRRFGQKRGV